MLLEQGNLTTIPMVTSGNKGWPHHPDKASRTDKQQSSSDINLLFSAAAQALVSSLLEGKVVILIDDIRLETTAGIGRAIHISERLSCNAEFQKMLASTPCLSLLKQLALRTLQQ